MKKMDDRAMRRMMSLLYEYAERLEPVQAVEYLELLETPGGVTVFGKIEDGRGVVEATALYEAGPLTFLRLDATRLGLMVDGTDLIYDESVTWDGPDGLPE